MNRTLRLLAAAAIAPLPWALKRPLLSALFGYRLHPGAWIGCSVIAADTVELADGARIGHLNVVRGLARLELAAHATLGQLNWITGFPARTGSRHFAHLPARAPQLLLGPHSAVTSRHLLDCTDTVRVGAFATVAGFRSQVLTHSVDLEVSRQSAAPVEIGERSFVGTGCIVLGGAKLPACSVLAAGAVLRDAPGETHTLYAGVPARAVKKLPADWQYFGRERGFVE